MPSSTQTLLLSPAELDYLHKSLSQTPPLRPDGRTTTQFRPLIAESTLLPSTNGSARVCWSEGEECIVGVKCEVEKTTSATTGFASLQGVDEITQPKGSASWVTLSIEIPGFRGDDPLPVFLGSMLTEALVQSGFLAKRLVINERWHWRLYIDILLLAPPLSYPLPLLSMTIHLALLDTLLPRLVSEGEEDPLFDDDWAAAINLYSSTPLSGTQESSLSSKGPSPPPTVVEKPPITLLITSINNKILFDPSREEIAVADTIVAVSLAGSKPSSSSPSNTEGLSYTLLSIRIIDTPAHLTPHGVRDSENPATFTNNTTSTSSTTTDPKPAKTTIKEEPEVWTPPLGGMSRSLIGRIVGMCIGNPHQGQIGVASEVFEGLESFVTSRIG